MELLSLIPALKSSLDIIHGIIRSLQDKRDEKRDFWLNNVLEPLNSAMGAVHETYIKTFDEAFRLSLKDDARISELLEFLRDRHRETLSIRDNLQALRLATRSVEGQPRVIRSYLSACESYFGDATDQGVSTPLRELLSKLEKRDHVTGMSLAEIEKFSPRSIRKCLTSQIAEGLSGTTFNLNTRRKGVLEKYHDARLEMLRP
jgi:hypothetical protein